MRKKRQAKRDQAVKRILERGELDDTSSEESSEEIGSEQEVSSDDDEFDEEHEENGPEQEDTSDEESSEEIESEQKDTSDDDIEGGGGKGGDAIQSKTAREIKKAVRPSRACKVASRVCLEDTDELEESDDTVTPKTPPRRRETLYRLATKQSEYDFQIGKNKSSKK